ncbi:DUF732 domain-containing protein [Mycolicibacter virginiensis]|uniref:DUF732 domain-containing protein n=1 Tax=Mycolicibacter virginiensis TaxID=1795032 RepID=UPI00217CF994|nr:DUF732 domain-containing protein [Mycolicibacter virginiensis]ULP48023.2 DUF732 domain-containing protein [Mycolicibacter virginiensis]
MGRITRAVGIGVGAAGLLLGTAGVAQADDRSFLDLVHANGLPDRYGFFGNVGDSETLMLGHMTCDGIRAGIPADQAMPQLTWDTEHLRPMLIDASQRELCPDTLQGAQ